MLLKIIIFNSVFFAFLCANPVIANKDYLIRNGLTSNNNKAMVDGDALKKELNNQIKVKTKHIDKLNLKNALIFKEIKKHQIKVTKSNIKGNFIALPSSYIKEKKDYLKIENEKLLAKNEKLLAKKDINELLLLKCIAFNDYKIYNSANMKMICYDNNVKYKLFAQITISKDKVNLTSKPYLIEDEYGKKYFLNNKSKLYNATNGSSNLATYVDKRVIEKVTKAMGDTVGTDTPTLTKDYLAQKNKANSQVIQNNNGSTTTTTTATTNPQPKVDDYGIKLLVDTFSSGLKAATDQLYTDLGYIYFIPKGSVFDAQIIIKKAK